MLVVPLDGLARVPRLRRGRFGTAVDATELEEAEGVGTVGLVVGDGGEEPGGDPPAAAPPQATQPQTAGYEARKDRRRNLAALKRTVERLEREVADLESELARLDVGFADAAYYERPARESIERDSRRREAIQVRLGAALEEWGEAAAALEALATV